MPTSLRLRILIATVAVIAVAPGRGGQFTRQCKAASYAVQVRILSTVPRRDLPAQTFVQRSPKVVSEEADRVGDLGLLPPFKEASIWKVFPLSEWVPGLT